MQANSTMPPGLLHLRARFVTTALATATGLGISSALNMAALLIWIRLLPPAQFATLALATAAAQVVNALTFEGLRLAAARTLPSSGGPQLLSSHKLISWKRTAFTMTAVLVVVTLGATALGLAPPGLAPGWNIAILALALSEALLGAVALLARLRFAAGRFAAIMVGRSAASLAFGLLLVNRGAGPAGVVAATAFAQACVTILASSGARAPAEVQPVSRRGMDGELIRFALPLALGCGLSLFAATIDRSLVAASLGLAAAGQFAAPAELAAKALGFALMAVNLSAYPALVQSWERRGPAATAPALARNLRLMLALGVPPVAAAALFPLPIVATFLGPTHLATGAAILPWLAGTTLLRLLTSLHFGVALQLARRMKSLLVPPLVSLAVLVPLALPALDNGGLIRFAQLLCVAQAAGMTAAWLLSRAILSGSPISSSRARTRPPSSIATAPSSVAPQ